MDIDKDKDRERSEKKERTRNDKATEVNSLSAMDKQILNFAQRQQGKYDNQEHIQFMGQFLDEVEIKAAERLIEKSLNNLQGKGWLEVGENKEIFLSSLADDWLKNNRQSKLPQNYYKLLVNNKDGILALKDIRKQADYISFSDIDKRNRIIDGMIKKLIGEKLLVRKYRGVYGLTLEGKVAIKENEVRVDFIKTIGKNNKIKATDGLKITKFDKYFLEVVDNTLKIDKQLLAKHPKKAAIEKRLLTLKEKGFFVEDTMTKEMEERICLAYCRAENKGKTITLSLMTREQIQLFGDMKHFLNLTPRQIEEHIYGGNRNLMATDVRWLLEKQVLKKAIDYDVYVLGTQGIRLYNEAMKGKVKYKSKVYGKSEELNHDILIYDAYKHEEKELVSRGCIITDLKNDRQLRRESALEQGCMKGEYPDLRIYFTDPKANEKEQEQFKDIEIDIAYNTATINKKLEGFFCGESGYYSSGGGSNKGQQATQNANTSKDIGWYCSTAKQALKVANAFKKMEQKTKSKGKTKKLEIFVVDENGKSKKVLF